MVSKKLLRGLCHALRPSPFGTECRIQADIWNSSLFSHYLIICSPNLPFCFSLGHKSGPSSQDLPHNLCPPKYVFPLATFLHLELSPGRKTVKSFQSFAAFLLTVNPSKGIMTLGVTNWKSVARLSSNKQWLWMSPHYLKLYFTSPLTGIAGADRQELFDNQVSITKYWGEHWLLIKYCVRVCVCEIYIHLIPHPSVHHQSQLHTMNAYN